MLNGCPDNSEGGVDNVSLAFDFDDFAVNDDKNVDDKFDELGDGSAFDGDGRCTVELKDVGEVFSSILIVVLELERSIGIEEGRGTSIG